MFYEKLQFVIAAVKLQLGLILFFIKSWAKVHFSVKGKKQEMSVNEFKLFITVCALFRLWYIMWECGSLSCD